MSTLSKSFEECYESSKTRDRRSDFKSLSYKEQLLYELEELAQTRTDAWEKERIRLSIEDYEKIVQGLVDQMDVEPVYLDKNISRRKEL